MSNSWTGIQYSVFRLLLGIYLFVFFFSFEQLPHSSQSTIFSHLFGVQNSPVLQFFRPLGFIASICLAGGLFQGPVAGLLMFLVVCLFQLPVQIEHTGLIFLSLLLIWQTFLPSAPAGSLAHCSRSFINYSWHISDRIYGLLWIAAAFIYGLLALSLDLFPGWIISALILLAVFLNRKSEKIGAPGVVMVLLWLCCLIGHLFFISSQWSLNNFAQIFLFYGFLFNPAWLSGKNSNSKNEFIFYDGNCGLCHRWVSFVLSEEVESSGFRFAPLMSQACKRELGDPAQFADSILVKTEQGLVLQRSEAVLYILRRLGGFWRPLARVLALIPSSGRNWLYDRIAQVRHKFFKKPDAACPLLPAELISRFETS